MKIIFFSKTRDCFARKLISQAGFTLLEIIVSILLIGIIGVVTMSFLTNLIQTNQDSSGQLEVIEDVNTALDFMARELRQVDEFSWPIRCGNPSGSCVPGTVYTRILFSKDVEVPSDPARQDTNTNDIVYNLNGTSLERTSGVTTTTLATNVSSFSIREIPLPGAPPGTPNGLFEIILGITRPSPDPSVNYQFTGTTAVQIRNRFPVLNIAFVIRTLGSPNGNYERPIRDHLVNVMGQNVQYFDDDDQAWTPTDFNVVILSGLGGQNTDAWLSNSLAPILTVDAHNFNEFDLGDSPPGPSRNGNNTTPFIRENSHFITKIFPTGSITLDSGGVNRGWIQNFANHVRRLISYNDADFGKLLVVQSGGQLATGGPGNTAPARRAFLGMRQWRAGGTVQINREGHKIFNRTVAWLAGLD